MIIEETPNLRYNFGSLEKVILTLSFRRLDLVPFIRTYIYGLPIDAMDWYFFTVSFYFCFSTSLSFSIPVFFSNSKPKAPILFPIFLSYDKQSSRSHLIWLLHPSPFHTYCKGILNLYYIPLYVITWTPVYTDGSRAVSMATVV